MGLRCHWRVMNLVTQCGLMKLLNFNSTRRFGAHWSPKSESDGANTRNTSMSPQKPWRTWPGTELGRIVTDGLCHRRRNASVTNWACEFSVNHTFTRSRTFWLLGCQRETLDIPPTEEGPRVWWRHASDGSCQRPNITRRIFGTKPRD